MVMLLGGKGDCKGVGVFKYTILSGNIHYGGGDAKWVLYFERYLVILCGAIFWIVYSVNSYSSDLFIDSHNPTDDVPNPAVLSLHAQKYNSLFQSDVKYEDKYGSWDIFQ